MCNGWRTSLITRTSPVHYGRLEAIVRTCCADASGTSVTSWSRGTRIRATCASRQERNQMTRYLVTDTEIQYAIHNAITCQDKNPQGNNYIIANTLDVARHVLRLLHTINLGESEQTENSKQDTGREINTSEHPFIRLQSNELVEMICDAYQTGVFSGKEQS